MTSFNPLQKNKAHDKGALSFKGVRYQSQNNVLIDSITIDLDLNEPVYVVGYNGSGKSLFLKLLIGYLTPTSGCIEFSDESGIKKSAELSYSSQKVSLLNRSVFDNVDFVLKQSLSFQPSLSGASLSKHERKQAVNGALEFTHLLSKRELNAHKLSGGEQQRLALARAIASQSELIVLDEPTANLDPASTRRYEELLCQIVRDKSMVLVSHNLAQMKRLGLQLYGKVCFLHEGRCLELTPVAEFLAQPKTKIAQSFLEAHSFW